MITIGHRGRFWIMISRLSEPVSGSAIVYSARYNIWNPVNTATTSLDSDLALQPEALIATWEVNKVGELYE